MRLKIIKCGGVNCYLLSDGGSSVLIDTAFGCGNFKAS